MIRLPGHDLKHKADWAESETPVGVPKAADLKALRTHVFAILGAQQALRAQQAPSCTSRKPSNQAHAA